MPSNKGQVSKRPIRSHAESKLMNKTTPPEKPAAALPDSGGYLTLAGPFKAADDGLTLEAGPHHMNGYNNTHGGLVMSFASATLRDLAEKTASGPCRLVSFNSDFLAAGGPTDLLEGKARVTRATRSILFIEGTVSAGDRVLNRATAIYAVGDEA